MRSALTGTFSRKIEPVVSRSVSRALLVDEVELIRNKGCMLLSSGEYELYCCSSGEIPLMMHEISRLREKSFREVGEGTGNICDNDIYDVYYLQLFLWDKKRQALVGAYRIGKGDEIIKNYGKSGLYLSTLYKMKAGIVPILEQSIELGRSFIIKEYRRKPLPLFLLWKGIFYFLLGNPQYRYLIGPVSISAEISPEGRTAIIKYLDKHRKNEQISAMIKPRNKFKPVKLPESLLNAIDKGKEFTDFKKILKTVDPNDYLPILIQKYLQIGASILDFNVDPDFNFAVDGFVFLDKTDVPKSFVKSLAKNLPECDFRKLETFEKS